MKQSILALLAVAALTTTHIMPAMAYDCPVPYSEFEGNIAHIDMPACPQNKPDADTGFCRLVLQGDDAFIYTFTFTEDDPCLSDIKKAKKSVYLIRK